MSTNGKSAQAIDFAFVATIISDSNSGWACVQMRGSAEFFGTGKAVKVAGTVDDHPYEASMLPVGNGTHMMPLRAPFRKVIGKGLGDEVKEHLTSRIV
ncbi:MAG: DUF1905 domain-containing protein [Thermomicrobiales bacterium]